MGENQVILSLDEQKTILKLARETIESKLFSLPPPGHNDDIPLLAQVLGVFVTLTDLDHNLRGCIGNIIGQVPLKQGVCNMALAAAFSDPRFQSVSALEWPGISIEISILSNLFPIRPEEVVTGVHGLLLSCSGRHGVFLPQVAPEQGWNRLEFLEGLCRKAGLPAGTWQHPEAKLEAFTAFVFSERSVQ